MAIRKTRRDKAAETLEAERDTLKAWQRRKTDADEQLGELNAQPGDVILDDPDAGARMMQSLRDLRDAQAVASKAITAQEARVRAAEREFLLAEAVQYEEPLQEAQAALAAHQKRTDELLAKLREHEGEFVPARDLVLRHAQERLSVGETVTVPTLKSTALAAAVRRAERPIAILKALAAGEQPQVALEAGEAPEDVYPASVWGPNAVVPAPAYLAAIRSAQQRLASIDRTEKDLQAAVETDHDPQEASRGRRRFIPAYGAAGRLDKLQADRDATRQRLTKLTDEPVA